MKTIPISFELFPPNTLGGIRKLNDTCKVLNGFHPEYFSVTFGASGANRKKTFRTIRVLCAEGFSVTPHLTCIGMPKPTLRRILMNYKHMNISRLVVLRGDLPKDVDESLGDFKHADELVAFIRQETGNHFHIDVAAYPEFHPESKNAFTGLVNFKRKIDAGADGAITQYFFNREAYLRFLESCEHSGIHVPIVPGIMPVGNFQKLLTFSQRCGAEIPLWLCKRLEALQGDPQSLRCYGIEVVTKLCEDLIASGAPGLHFYTLNQLEPTQSIVKNIMNSSTSSSVGRTVIIQPSAEILEKVQH